MLTIKPLKGHLVKPEWAERVVAPAYDSMLPSRRAEFADANPDNYVNTMRSPEEYPSHARPSSGDLLLHNHSRFEKVMVSGHYRRLDRPCYFVYRLNTRDHCQTGVVANVSIRDYESGRIRIHERTQQTKESDLVRYQQVVGASSSPIALAYRHDDETAGVLGMVTCDAPILEFKAHDDVVQTIWAVAEGDAERRLEAAFGSLDSAYLTDGHHRSAALAEYARQRRAAGEETDVNMLVALFPDSELRILPYHRAVALENDSDPARIIEDLSAAYEVSVAADPAGAAPARPHSFGMWLGGSWYALHRREPPAGDDDPVRGLDVSVLVDDILQKIFHVEDCRTDPRLSYVAGSDGLGMLESHCRETNSAGFACYPTSLEQLMAVADAGRVMPPKSTWFDPKVRSGIFITRL